MKHNSKFLSLLLALVLCIALDRTFEELFYFDQS